jgi:glycosyltransferase involved in cell wall biosynthesis
MLDRIVVINDVSTAKGGATGLALASIRGFRAMGHPVTLLTGDSGDNEDLRADGVEVMALGQARLLSSPLHKAAITGLYNSAAERMVTRWIEQYDTPKTVYHLHGWAQILSPSIFHALRPVMRRVTLSAHDFFLVCPNGAYSFLKTGEICALTPQSIGCIGASCDRSNYANKLWRVGRQAVRRLTLPLRADAPSVLMIHERMRPHLERGGAPGAALSTLPNPVTPFVNYRVEAEANREFLFIGRLEHGKGPDLACAAAAEAGVPLRVIGDGPMEDSLKREFPDVAFSGRLTHGAITPFVRQARALVMPSRYPEPYGLVAAEALWSGVPVIAADTAFMAPDIVERGAGAACTPRNLAAFSAVLRRFAGDDQAVLRMSLAAFNSTRDLGSTMDGWLAALISHYRVQVGRTATV